MCLFQSYADDAAFFWFILTIAAWLNINESEYTQWSCFSNVRSIDDETVIMLIRFDDFPHEWTHGIHSSNQPPCNCTVWSVCLYSRQEFTDFGKHDVRFSLGGCRLGAVTGVLKGYDQLLNLVLDESVEYLRGAQQKTAFSNANALLILLPILSNGKLLSILGNWYKYSWTFKKGRRFAQDLSGGCFLYIVWSYTCLCSEAQDNHGETSWECERSIVARPETSTTKMITFSGINLTIA